MHPKEISHVDEDYLEWIRRQPSIVSGTFGAWDADRGEGRNDAHHVWCTGKRGKRNDYLAVPLTRGEHQVYHSQGHDSFEKRFNIRFEWECLKLLMTYLGQR